MVIWLVVLASAVGAILAIAHRLGLDVAHPATQSATRGFIPLLLALAAALLTHHRIRKARSRRQRQRVLGAN